MTIFSVENSQAPTHDRDLPTGKISELHLRRGVLTDPVSTRRATFNLYLTSPIKRTVDLLIAVALSLFFLPLLLTIALAVRMTSRGPILFRQRRGGQGGTPFSICKFRTMYVDADDGSARQAIKGDARITPIGRILRTTSADELPQLINVIRGDMSIVGPRPHALQHDRYYATRIDGYTERSRAKPGITGLAQVHNLRGPTPTVEMMARRVEMDVRYVESASLILDLRILVRTVLVVFLCCNAL